MKCFLADINSKCFLHLKILSLFLYRAVTSVLHVWKDWILVVFLDYNKSCIEIISY